MLNSIVKFFQVVAFVIASAAGLLAIFYSAYILIFLMVIGILILIGLVLVNWDAILAWADEED